MDWLGLASGLSLSNLVLGLFSLSWLLWRAHKVLETPVDDLVKLLGLEVPVAPVATLLEISATSVAIHWKPPDQRSSAIKHKVNLNGSTVGEVPNHGNAVSIINLQPGRFYAIRIIAINASNFQASSDAIRVRTGENTSHDGENSLRASVDIRAPNPSIVAYRTFLESQAPPPTPPTMAREHSGSVSQTKRGIAVRRGSPATHGDTITPPSEAAAGHGDPPNNVSDLTTRLENIRHEIEELEKQDDEEEREFQNMQIILTERRESLRQQLKGRDDESNELKRNVTSLERQNTAAQTKKTKQEKQLNQKLNERSKLHDEVKRWEKEVAEFKQEASEFAVRKVEFQASAQHQLRDICQEQEEDTQATKALEEGIREAGTRVKELEEEKKSLEEGPAEAGLPERQRKSIQEEMEWSDRLQLLQSRYQNAWSACTQAQQLYQQTQQRLEFLNTRHSTQAIGAPAQYAAESQPSSIDASSNHTNGGSRSSFVATEPVRPLSLSSRGLSGPSAVFQSPSPFFSSVILPISSNPLEGITDAEAEILTGGALASPTAGALLPAGLLGDDGEDVIHGRLTAAQAPYLPGLGAAPDPDSFEGPDDARQDLTSPLSMESGSPSLISSPHGSISNFHHSKLSESRIESDRVSIRSASSSSRVAPPRRFAGVLGFSRSRATSNEGLPLGSLKRYESRSMPRQNEEPSSGLTGTGGFQRRGGSSGGLFGSVSQVFGRIGGPSGKVVEEGDNLAPGPPAARGGSFGLLGSISNPWARADSSRPASMYSTYSMENALPPPSTDSQPFGWSANDNGNSSSLTQPWQAYSSRRQSIQHDSSISLTANINQLDVDSQELTEAEKSPTQAPIGTKPAKSRLSSPLKQLNPAARDFRSMLSRDKTGDKSRKTEKTLVGEDESVVSADDSSPPESRKSKEKRFSSAAESFEEPSEDQMTDSPGKTSEKESLVRRITRKGSSTRFSQFSSGLFSRKGGQSTEDVDEDGASSTLGRSLESVASSQHSPGDKRGILSSFKRRGKKGIETPSISEASMASETGDETDERASVDVDDY